MSIQKKRPKQIKVEYDFSFIDVWCQSKRELDRELLSAEELAAGKTAQWSDIYKAFKEFDIHKKGNQMKDKPNYDIC
jgi:hypothetical protein